MKHKQFTYHKDKVSKYLLIVTLLLSFFAFSSYSGYSRSYHGQAAKTELVVSKQYKLAKRTILYKNAFTSVHICNPLNNSAEYKIQVLLAYNMLTKVKFNHISIKLYSFNIAPRFFQIKTVPQSSYEAISLLQ